MRKNILLVEDDAAIIETLSLFLRYEGYEVRKARTIQQAVSDLDSARPDLLLLDYMLQDDTAEPVVAALRARYATDVKVILFTAADDPESKGEAISADAVVSKPFELDELIQTIRRCLAESEAYAATGLPNPDFTENRPSI